MSENKEDKYRNMVLENNIYRDLFDLIVDNDGVVHRGVPTIQSESKLSFHFLRGDHTSYDIPFGAITSLEKVRE